MKVGNITQPNAKGQVVIPKAVRDELNITQDTHLQVSLQDDAIVFRPVKVTASSRMTNGAYLQLLKKTRGAWANEDFSWIEKRRRIELAAAKKLKKEW